MCPLAKPGQPIPTIHHHQSQITKFSNNLARKERKKETEKEMAMVSLMKLMDRVLIVFSIAFGVAAPFDAGLLFLTPNLDPNNNLLVHHLKPLYEFKYGDYLVTNKPAFFVALVWLEVVFLWPLQLLNLYGILSPHASWLPLTFLLFGASYCTTMYAVLAEVMSHTVSDTLIMFYLLFIGCGVLSILRGLLTYYSSAAGKTTKINTRHESSGSGKKRA
ncbi:hypothetical protein LOK49_LG05G02054 [Camellia lanceoleosa]|uniref:Uncharacterized protein n=1 Tax=Camellia lanceoleosa TaxID=1840588 RepID=A0ACC0HMS6_9ERIC|nr:hypothetical protein LOK49_LG05G02054 [Camellia lanceoleosa]